jgi:hypothetical protein
MVMTRRSFFECLTREDLEDQEDMTIELYSSGTEESSLFASEFSTVCRSDADHRPRAMLPIILLDCIGSVRRSKSPSKNKARPRVQ